MRLFSSAPMPLALLAAGALAACSDDDDPTVGPLYDYAVVVSQTEIGVGQDSTEQISVKVRNVTLGRDSIPNAQVVFTTDDRSIARVSSTGEIKGVKGGTTTVRAIFRDDTVSIAVTVRPYPAASVTITETAARLYAPATSGTAGDQVTLAATVRDAASRVVYCNSCTSPPAKARVVEWTSLDTLKATVTSVGRVTARDTGKVKIVISEPDGKADTSEVTISWRPVTSVVVTPSPSTLAAAVKSGQTLQLAASPRGANSATLANRTVIWESLNTAVATVDATGLVRAKSVTTKTAVTIRATSEGKTGTFSIDVHP